MKSLFLKIFLFYWLAQALFLVLAILVTLAVRQRGEFAAWQSQQAKVLTTAVETYEQSGEAPVRRYLDDVRESQHVRIYLFDEHGAEISARPLPHWAESMQRGVAPPPRDIWQRMMPSPFQRQTITSPSGHRYAMVVALPPGPFGPEGIPGLGILIGIISSGLVCYLLAHYLTALPWCGCGPRHDGWLLATLQREWVDRIPGGATKLRNWCGTSMAWRNGWSSP